MWLISGINAADFNDPRPGTVIAGRIEADNLSDRLISAPCWLCKCQGRMRPSRSAPSTFSTMAATLPLCGCWASRPTSG
jgi:hypothetical protein